MMGKSLRKQDLIIVAGIFVFSITSLGCQNPEIQSNAWKRQKIMAMYNSYAHEFPLVEGITVEELQQLQRQTKDIVLVDVRSPKEQAISQIPKAITVEEFEKNLPQYAHDTVIAYCTIGYRSGKYAEKWRQQGVKILNLEGSLLAWSHIQGELIDANGMTNKVHVFGRQWQLTAENYQPVW